MMIIIIDISLNWLNYISSECASKQTKQKIFIESILPKFELSYLVYILNVTAKTVWLLLLWLLCVWYLTPFLNLEVAWCESMNA